jgi:hypothetical protein
MLTVDFTSVLGWLHCVDVSSVADVSEVHVTSVFRVEIYETSVTFSTSTQCNHPKTEIT